MLKGKIQVTLIQIDEYGPWTLCLGPDREAKLQILQARLYSDLQKYFAKHGGIIFFNRFDNMIAISNGISKEQHQKIQSKICKKYPVTISMGIGVGKTPYEAQKIASQQLIKQCGSNLNGRKKIIANCSALANDGESVVQITHFDIKNSTKTITNNFSAYDAFQYINKTYDILVKALRKKGAIVFFCGGDNFISPSNGVTEVDLLKAIDLVYRKTNLQLGVGVGIGKDARMALKLATESLDGIRRKEFPGPIHFKCGVD
jgi:GTP cyclohydrolase IIa